MARALLSSSNNAARPVNILLTGCGVVKCLFRETNEATAVAELMEFRS